MKMHSFISVVLVCFLIFSSSSLLLAQTSDDNNNTTYQQVSTSEWYKQPQVYNIVAFPPEDIEKYHITVNGLWNGFIGENLSSPFALGRLVESAFSGRTYHSDKEFVDAQHAQGMIVPATILTIQGHRSFQEDSFEDFACRSINGELCPWDVDADSYWMNAINPGFIDWCIQHGKKAIDAGADMIVLDEIQGNSFIPLYQWAAQYTGLPAPGFSNETIEGFRSYISTTYSPQDLLELFDINDVDTVDLKTRIAQTMNLTYNQRIQADPLIKEYQSYLETSNFEAKKRLILALRTYAKEQNKDIVISANSYALGTNQPFGFWPKGLIFADLLDLFTFENTYTAVLDQTIPDFYRTKWLAWERLAYAATAAPAVILIDTSTVEAIHKNLFPLFGFSNSLGILCAEAYANKGSFVNYHFQLFGREKNWKRVEQIHEFVMGNPEIFDYSSDVWGNVGIVFLYSEGMQDHMNTYLGCAQAFAESHIPFDVVFDGDDLYLNTSLSLKELERFSLIVVPSLLLVTEKQKQIVKEYVHNGGVALIFDGEELGFQDATGEVPYGDGLFYFFEEDYGKLYFETYIDSYRQVLADCVHNYVSDVLTVNADGRKIVVTPYIQQENNRMTLHMINYDHIGFFDFIWPVSPLEIHLLKPSFSIEQVSLLSPGEKTVSLPYEISDDTITITVPSLKDYGVIVIE